MKSKKIVNNPKNVVPELIDGLVAVSRGRIKKVGSVNALVRSDLRPSKVGLLIGGGSGHEPLFGGFIGEGLADGANVARRNGPAAGDSSPIKSRRTPYWL